MPDFVVISVPFDELAPLGARLMNKFVPHHTTRNISVTFNYDIKFSSKYSQYYHIPSSPFHSGLILSMENLDIKSFTLYANDCAYGSRFVDIGQFYHIHQGSLTGSFWNIIFP